jgi:hypothetical protein
MKPALLRYAAVVLLVVITIPLSMAYYASSLYQGGANVPLSTGNDIELLPLLLIPTLLIGLKYLIYDAIAGAMLRRYPSRTSTRIFYAGYLIAVLVDLASVFASNRPIADAGFAIFAAILYSPVVLGLALIVLSVITLKQKSRLS